MKAKYKSKHNRKNNKLFTTEKLKKKASGLSSGEHDLLVHNITSIVQQHKGTCELTQEDYPITIYKLLGNKLLSILHNPPYSHFVSPYLAYNHDPNHSFCTTCNNEHV